MTTRNSDSTSSNFVLERPGSTGIRLESASSTVSSSPEEHACADAWGYLQSRLRFGPTEALEDSIAASFRLNRICRSADVVRRYLEEFEAEACCTLERLLSEIRDDLIEVASSCGLIEATAASTSPAMRPVEGVL